MLTSMFPRCPASTSPRHAAVAALLLALVAPAAGEAAGFASIERVSMLGDGTQSDHESARPAISADGSLVVFDSLARNLHPGDYDNWWDVYVKLRASGDLDWVSRNTAGTENNGFNGAISGDGRWVAFESSAVLVAGDSNAKQDIYLRDRQTGATTRVSVATNGDQASDHSYAPSLSADGRHIAFASLAGDLAAGDDNLVMDVFVHDRVDGSTTRVSVTSAGVQATGPSENPSISADGRYVAFSSAATDLVAGDGNAARDIFVHDRQTGQTVRVSVDMGGGDANDASVDPSVSADGNLVAFTSAASNLVAADGNLADDIFVRNVQGGTTVRASLAYDGAEANSGSYYPAMSGNGRYVAFKSLATNLVATASGGGQVFRRDLSEADTLLVSRNQAGDPGEQASTYPAISYDGAVVAFESDATNLVGVEVNLQPDIFAVVFVDVAEVFLDGFESGDWLTWSSATP